MDTPIAAPATIAVKPPRKGLLSPPNLRRWENFKANRRGYWSLWLNKYGRLRCNMLCWCDHFWLCWYSRGFYNLCGRHLSISRGV